VSAVLEKFRAEMALDLALLGCADVKALSRQWVRIAKAR
jgi:isopentenyl diphosphate isomerase/L-lactate dehydrogenase-like FMN-dependent dehydrogenase